MPGCPNLTNYFEYKILNKHVEYSDQHMDAVHPGLSNIGSKVMKVCTIIKIIRTLAMMLLVLLVVSC